MDRYCVKIILLHTNEWVLRENTHFRYNGYCVKINFLGTIGIA